MNQNVSLASLQDALLVAYENVLTTIIAFLPQILAAIVTILIGVLVAGWLKTIVKKILQAIKLSNVTKNTAVETFLEQAQIKLKVEEFVGEVVRWAVLLVFLITAINIVGLTTVSAFLMRILSYLPQVFSAALIFTLGIIAAGVVEGLVKGALSSFDVATGRLVAKISSYTLVVFTSLIAIGELGIAESFINTLFIGFVAMLSLGLGLAFGLGAKDLVGDILRVWYQDFQKDLKRK
jgi:hypothetical protein